MADISASLSVLSASTMQGNYDDLTFFTCSMLGARLGLALSGNQIFVGTEISIMQRLLFVGIQYKAKTILSK
jgi:hypothetical protein